MSIKVPPKVVFHPGDTVKVIGSTDFSGFSTLPLKGTIGKVLHICGVHDCIACEFIGSNTTFHVHRSNLALCHPSATSTFKVGDKVIIRPGLTSLRYSFGAMKNHKEEVGVILSIDPEDADFFCVVRFPSWKYFNILASELSPAPIETAKEMNFTGMNGSKVHLSLVPGRLGGEDLKVEVPGHKPITLIIGCSTITNSDHEEKYFSFDYLP